MPRLLSLLLLVAALQCRPAGEAPPAPDAAAGGIPSFTLTDADSAAFGAEQLRGRVWIATVIFTRSQNNTPQQTAAMAALQQRLADDPARSGVRLVSLTAEPERDTPAVLRAYAARHGADATRWHFLTGPRPALTALVRDGLGLPVLSDSGGARPVTLSPRLVLVDRQMRVRGTYDAAALETLLADLDRVLPEAPHLDDGTGRTHLVYPPQNLDLGWLGERAQTQRAAAQDLDAFHDFRFTDRRAASGIGFRHRIVDNAGKAWMPNHYDHGNGVAVADVDGDGRLDLYFTTQVGRNALYRNLGGGRFEDVTETAGVALDGRVSVAASFADVDNDGDADLYVTSVRGGNALLLNDGGGRFTDASAASGLDYSGHSSGAVFFDYDRDGLLDLYLANVGVYTTDRRLPVTNGTSPEQTGGRYQFYEGREDAFIAHLFPGRAETGRLYRNLGNARFEDVTEAMGLRDDGWSGDAVPFDADSDGWTDLYVLNMQGDDAFFRNMEGRRFERRSRAVFPRTPWGTMGAATLDADGDGALDLLLTDMHSDMSQDVGPAQEKLKAAMQWPDSLLQTDGRSLFGNALFRNAGGGAFREISDAVGAENYWPWGPSAGDLNADGYDDVFIASSMNYPFRYGINTVLLNDGGRGFADAEFLLGVEPRPEGHRLTPWFTLACDGADATHEHCAGRTGEAVVWAARGSRSAAVFDLDDDGDLDVVTNDFNSEPLVLVSDLAERRGDALRYLQVRLQGTESNRDGLGAVVTVYAGDRAITRAMDGVSGYLSHSVMPLYFGLGEA
ncbi:MAG: FG-GAP-like repeat-containing protein, partial [Rhodothermales bacterium]|nr:FG-GAP-like repeat-containing protein [Rhodothermales bacterium]